MTQVASRAVASMPAPPQDLSRRMDMAVVQREKALQKVDEAMLESAKVLMVESERTQKSCDDARARARKSRLDLSSATNRLQAAKRELNDLQSRAAALEMACSAEAEAKGSKGDELPPTPSFRETLYSNAQKRAQMLTSSSAVAEAAGEYDFLVDRLRAEVEGEEASVTTLKLQHQDLFARLRSLSVDVERMKEDVSRSSAHLVRLQEEQLIIAAAQANPAHREAIGVYQKYKAVEQKVEQLDEELRQLRIESTTLISHLLTGADQRSEAVLAQRRSLLKVSESADASSAHFATQLLRENSSRRSALASVIVNCAQEREALRQYMDVLNHRIEDATHRHFVAVRRQPLFDEDVRSAVIQPR